MEARLNPLGTEIGPKLVKHIVSAAQVLAESTLPVATQELVRIRASQINACAGCLDLHTKDALRVGETPVRLNLVAAWREASVFTDAERAALDLTEQGTRLADGGRVSDEAWANAVQYYDDEQLTALVVQIALINLFNRLNVITQQVAGDYAPGQFS